MQLITIKSYETKKSILMPVIFLIIGLILFLNPSGIVEFISYIIGGVLLTLGIGKIITDNKRPDKTTGDNFYSIVMIVLALVFIFSSNAVEFIFRLGLGIWIIVNAINTILVGTSLLKQDRKNIITLIFGFILLIMGIYTIYVENIILSTLGIILIIYSILEIIDYFYIMVKNK